MSEVGIRPVDEWPRLLAGPMVRRVTPTRAHIWICTKMTCQARVVLYPAGADHAATNSIATGAWVTPERLGERMYVTVLPVDIPATLSAGSTVAYDVEIKQGSSTRGLFELGLLGGTAGTVGDEFDAKRAEVPLGYSDGALPAFVTPVPHVSALRVVHASCRKPHGGGADEPEAMHLIDDQIKNTLNLTVDPTERPQQLVLTGDQIYADDVAAGLLAALTEAGDRLLGWTEEFPVIGTNPILQTLMLPGWRTRFLSIPDIGLKEEPPDLETTDYSWNHLLTFGEWCAMYLFAWSDALWRIDHNDHYTVPQHPSGVPIADLNQLIGIADTIGLVAVPARAARALEVLTWLDEFNGHVNDEWAKTRLKVLGYAKSVRLARRVLANVATYTMFDDHEITDDWYLNQRVHDKLKGNSSGSGSGAVGPRMLRNGLTSYAIFQHWGNVPDDFDPGTHGATLLDKVRFDGTTCRMRSHPRELDQILAITPGDSTIPPSRQRSAFDRMRWDYAIEFPSHRLIALDTRTWRYFPPGEPFTWASLAPHVPHPPGSPADSGADEVRALAAAWRQARTDTGEIVMQHFADVVESYADLGESVAAGRAQFVNEFAELFGNVVDFLNHLPGRASSSVPSANDPLGSFFRSMINTMSDPALLTDHMSVYSDDATAIDVLAQWLVEFSNFEFGPGTGDLTEVFESLGDFVDTAIGRSTVGMLFSARRAVAAAGAGVWQALTSIPISDSDAQNLLAAVDVVLGDLDTATQAIGLDRLAAAIFRDGSNRLGVGLIRQDALEFMVTDAIAATGPATKTSIVLSPAPIFGNRLVEMMQRANVVRLTARGEAGEEEMDYEAWSVNTPALLHLCEALGAMRCVVVLSGDVHYAGTSVCRVRTPANLSRIIQLTSSSSRNSDDMTRGLARLDDLLYDDDGTVLMFQADWAGRLAHGSSSAAHLADLARARVDEVIEDIENAVDLQRQWENVQHWWRTADPFMTWEDAADTAQRVVTAIPNTVRSLASEAAWQLYSGVQVLREFADDPMLAMFGDYLTAGPALRRHLRDFYREVGLDPDNGLVVRQTVIRDHRPQRLASSPALQRYRPDPLDTSENAAFRATNDWQRRTVGHANAGFITFDTSGDDIREVVHDLRWYPSDDPPRHTDPLPRIDWMSTLHRCGWYGLTHDIARPAVP